MKSFKIPWYYQTWFISLMFLLWPTVICLIGGIVLLILATMHQSKIKREFDELAQKLNQIGDFEAYIASIDAWKSNRANDANAEIASLESVKAELLREIASYQAECRVEASNVAAYENLKADEVKNELQMLRMRQNEMVKDDSAFQLANTNKTKRDIESQKKQIMRCYNAETVSIIESVTAKNVDSLRVKLQRSFENLNKLFTFDGVAISPKYHRTKLEELTMVYAYMVKQEEERELQKAIREQLKEEEKVRREIEQAKANIEKEQSQFTGEINKLMGYLQKATDIEKQLYVDKIRELEEKLRLLEKDKENVLQREQNTRAGFVYIISNIGSFGENVYKIGMTRRLEPMDRVKELGDASVPFSFDVHALIFSDDAPALETILHQTFRNNQVNKVNPRKEFFKVDLDSIKKIVTENHNATTHFIDEPDAVEYRESIRLSAEFATL